MNISIRAGNHRLSLTPPAWRVGLKSVLLLLAVIVASALFYAYTSIQALNTSFEVSRALSLQQELDETGRRLKVELNTLKNPGRLEREAARLNLYALSPEQVRSLP